MGAEFDLLVTIPLTCVLGTGVGVGLVVTTGVDVGVMTGAAVGVGVPVGTTVGVGTGVTAGVGVGFRVRERPVDVVLKTDSSLDTRWVFVLLKLKTVLTKFVVFAPILSLAKRKFPEGGEDLWLGSSPSTIEIRPVEFASDIEVTLIILAKDGYTTTSPVSFITFGSKVTSISLKSSKESELTQTSKLLSGGSTQDST